LETEIDGQNLYFALVYRELCGAPFLWGQKTACVWSLDKSRSLSAQFTVRFLQMKNRALVVKPVSEARS
jgi:hypothetical protein